MMTNAECAVLLNKLTEEITKDLDMCNPTEWMTDRCQSTTFVTFLELNPAIDKKELEQHKDISMLIKCRIFGKVYEVYKEMCMKWPEVVHGRIDS